MPGAEQRRVAQHVNARGLDRLERRPVDFAPAIVGGDEVRLARDRTRAHRRNQVQHVTLEPFAQVEHERATLRRRPRRQRRSALYSTRPAKSSLHTRVNSAPLEVTCGLASSTISLLFGFLVFRYQAIWHVRSYGPGRATVRRHRHADQHHAAVAHRFELPAQQARSAHRPSRRGEFRRPPLRSCRARGRTKVRRLARRPGGRTQACCRPQDGPGAAWCRPQRPCRARSFTPHLLQTRVGERDVGKRLRCRRARDWRSGTRRTGGSARSASPRRRRRTTCADTSPPSRRRSRRR